MRDPGVLIVGGGPAGAAAAITLAQAGQPHLLIERSQTFGDALCGGFLSWRTLDTLATLGIDPAALNPRATRRARLFANGNVAEAMLPRPARSVSRHRLDTLLLDHARAVGAHIERNVTARSIDRQTVRIDADAITPTALFLASGKYEVRGAARPVDRAADPTLGLRVRLPADAALDRLIGDAVELHLFDRGYAGLALQEDGSANLCLAVHRSRLAEASDPAALLRQLGDRYPALGERLARATALPGVDAVANVPYGWRATTTEPGIFRLGDQAAVIPSLAGEGMGIALHSGVAAAAAFAHGGAAAAPAFQQQLARTTRRPVAIAGLVRAAAERPATAPALVAAARIAPGLMNLVARLTRIAG